MNSKTIDWINIGLILISVTLAINVPFQLFLFSYAVLGPLHYLTEINWLKEKNYFSKKNVSILPFMLVLSIIFALRPMITWLSTNTDIQFFDNLLLSFSESSFLSSLSLIVILPALIFGIVSTLTKKKSVLITSTIVASIIGISLRSYGGYVLWIGILTPTIIHVYFFTILFMLYGALKSKSAPGLLSVIVAFLAILIISFYPFGDVINASNDVLKMFKSSTFETVIRGIARVFDVQFMNSRSDSIILNRIQSFIAFAYTYHYLNWFSKTSIIKWHKVSKKNLTITAIIWLISVSLYYIDYNTGLVFLFILSILHVFVEFPLNIVSIKGIIQEIRNGVQLKWR